LKAWCADSTLHWCLHLLDISNISGIDRKSVCCFDKFITTVYIISSFIQHTVMTAFGNEIEVLALALSIPSVVRIQNK
jgi:hypothetical protein